MPSYYNQDTTGVNPANLVQNESCTLTISNQGNYLFVVPRYAPYFIDSLVVTHVSITGARTTLNRGVDYHPALQFFGASRACLLPIAGAVSLINPDLTGSVSISYQTLGGVWSISPSDIIALLSSLTKNPRVTTWEEVANLPYAFPPSPHVWDAVDTVGMSEVVEQLKGIEWAMLQKNGGLHDLTFALSSADLALTTGLSLNHARAPSPMTLLSVKASLNAPSSSGNVVLNLLVNGVLALSTPITIEANEDSSITAASLPVISNSQIPADAKITFNIVSSGTNAKGLVASLLWIPQNV